MDIDARISRALNKSRRVSGACEAPLELSHAEGRMPAMARDAAGIRFSFQNENGAGSQLLQMGRRRQPGWTPTHNGDVAGMG